MVGKYLELLKCEATSSPNAAVVFDSWGSHNGAELVDRAGSNSSGLRKTGITTTVLASRLSL